MRADELVEAVRTAPKCVRGSWYTVHELAFVLGIDFAGLSELLGGRATSHSPAAQAGLSVESVRFDRFGPQIKYYYVSIDGETPTYTMRSEEERARNASAVSIAREARRERCSLAKETFKVDEPAVTFSSSRASTGQRENSHQETNNRGK